MRILANVVGAALVITVFGSCATGMKPEEFNALMATRPQHVPPKDPPITTRKPSVTPKKPKPKPAASPTTVKRQAEKPPAGNGKLSLAWDPSSDAETAGYRIRYGTQSGKYTGTFDAKGEAQATITGLEAGKTYYFVVVAYNRAGLASPPSNELSAVAK